ncbi:Alpha/beta hydrolase family protein [Dyadobacter soli]|uniref:Alpha/beta hydrolase family protein n=1 Tax=Dyadobacter soli TaxID=659014 RepID=A0A1G7MUU0_9BACT|nr:alpha/beta hydrolase [Dyadobacter soli]SDF64889.1 Alpha/beta hydrolase family protein [Dyadobacter soli]
MKYLILILAFTLSTAASAQKHKPRTFLLVHGAWSGGWDYAKVDSIFKTKGDIVFRPTLTGLGERVHLANANVNLSTYIIDIVNVIRYENLRDIILVGHSFGGMVISGVAEQVPDRIGQLIYLDAMIPDSGQSARDVCGPLWDQMMVPFVKDSVMQYPFGKSRTGTPGDLPQPIKTFTEPLKIGNPQVKKIPSAFIVMTKNGESNPLNDQMGLNKARTRGWKIYPMEGGHYSMREQPVQLVRKLEEVIRSHE